MTKFAKAILFLGLWAMISVSLGAQQRYASEQIRRLAEKLQVPASLHDGVNYKVAQYAGHPVTITCQGKEITHIGYSLFTHRQRQLIGSAHCDFIERLLMASDIKDFFGTSIDRYLREEKITFDKGSLQALKDLCSDTSFNIQITLQDERQYVFNWYVGNRRLVTVSYPNNYQLVTGCTMQELEARIAPALRATQVSATTPFRPVESMFQKMSNGGIYVFAGDIYMLPQLTSNRYYVKHPDGSFHVLYSKDFPAETMANLVTATDIDNALEMEILMVRYGHVKEALRVPLRQWVAYCLQRGCTPYFGVVEQTDKLLTCELVMRNEEFNYNHVMKFSFDPAMLEKGEGVIEARLTPYVLMSNVKSLFDEK